MARVPHYCRFGAPMRAGRLLSTLRLLTWLALFCAMSSWPRVTCGQLPCIELNNLSRSGAQIGDDFELQVVSGANLAEVNALRWSDPRIATTLLTDDPLPATERRLPRYGHFKVSLADELPPGRYEVRAVGRHGISNARAFLVSPLPDIFPEKLSHQAEAPIALPQSARLHAQTSPAVSDFFLVHLAQGQRIRIDLLAQQVESRLIGQLSLLDMAGAVVATVRGADEADPQLIAAIERSGDYLVEVRDYLYRGGEDYFYQLCWQEDAGAIEHIRPAAGTGATGKPAGQIPLYSHPSALVLAEQGSLLVPPVNTYDADQELPALPLASRVFGQFRTAGDETTITLNAEQGEDLAVEVFSHRLGEPADPLVWVEREEVQSDGDSRWHVESTGDDTQAAGDPVMRLPSRDPAALFRPSAKATYRVRLRDLDTGEGLSKQQSYWLDFRRAAPDFSLVAYRPCPIADISQSRPVGSNLWRGGAEAVRVVAIRRDGWNGPIEVSAANLPAGISCAPATIAANQTAVQLTLTASEDAPAWVGELQIVGRGIRDGEDHVRSAVPATIVRGPGGTRGFVWSRLASELVLSISDRDLAPLSIQLGEDSPIEARRGSSTALPIRLTRRDGGKEGFLIRARDAPPGAYAPEVTIPAEASEYKMDLIVPPGTAVGTYSMWLQAEAPLTFKPNLQALQRAEQFRADLAARLEKADRESEREAIEKAIKAAEERIEAAKPGAQDQRLIVHLPSTHVEIRIIE